MRTAERSCGVRAGIVQLPRELSGDARRSAPAGLSGRAVRGRQRGHRRGSARGGCADRRADAPRVGAGAPLSAAVRVDPGSASQLSAAVFLYWVRSGCGLCAGDGDSAMATRPSQAARPKLGAILRGAHLSLFIHEGISHAGGPDPGHGAVFGITAPPLPRALPGPERIPACAAPRGEPRDPSVWMQPLRRAPSPPEGPPPPPSPPAVPAGSAVG